MKVLMTRTPAQSATTTGLPFANCEMSTTETPLVRCSADRADAGTHTMYPKAGTFTGSLFSSDATKAPTAGVSTVGQWAMQFDGVDDKLQNGGAIALPLPFTVYLVLASTGDGTSWRDVFLCGPGAPAIGLTNVVTFNPAYAKNLNGGIQTTGNPNTGKPVVIAASIGAASGGSRPLTLALGSEIVTGSTTTTAANGDRMYLGNGDAVTTSKLKGSLFEVVVYLTAHSTATIADNVTRLSAWYRAV